jgi:hypothetical protein
MRVPRPAAKMMAFVAFTESMIAVALKEAMFLGLLSIR